MVAGTDSIGRIKVLKPRECNPLVERVSIRAKMAHHTAGIVIRAESITPSRAPLTVAPLAASVGAFGSMSPM